MPLWTLGLLVVTVHVCCFAVQANENIAIDCCLKTSTHPIQMNILLRYEDQNPEGGCPLPAVLFVTKKDKRLCAPPKLPWVMKRKKQLDNKKRDDNKKREDKKKRLDGQQKKNIGKKQNNNKKSKKSEGKNTP